MSHVLIHLVDYIDVENPNGISRQQDKWNKKLQAYQLEDFGELSGCFTRLCTGGISATLLPV